MMDMAGKLRGIEALKNKPGLLGKKDAPNDMKTLARFSPALLMGALVGLLLIPGDAQCIAEAREPQVTADAVDLALDFVPGVNVAKDIVALSLGVNPVTGEQLSEKDAAFLVAWILFPGMMRMARVGLTLRPGREKNRGLAAHAQPLLNDLASNREQAAA